MLPTLSDDIKARLRNGFDTVHEDPNITPEMIRGFGGILVDRYTSDITHETFQAVQEMLDLVTSEVKGEMLKRASEN
jgi:phosphonate transport system substrate-binding protein